MKSWNDSRISINTSVFDSLSIEDRWILLSREESAKIWSPCLGFAQIKEQSIISEESGGSPSQYTLTKDPDFRLYNQYDLKATITCDMDFTAFPFDEHECHFETSSGAPIQEIELIPFPKDRTGFPPWGRATTSATNLQHEVTFGDLAEERKKRPRVYFSGFDPVVSYAGFTMFLTRKSTPYVLNYYIPSSLLVAVSWVSYTIHPIEAAPGRITLIITTFLALANTANSAFRNSPINQGINSLQVRQMPYLLQSL